MYAEVSVTLCIWTVKMDGNGPSELRQAKLQPAGGRPEERGPGVRDLMVRHQEAWLQ